MAVTYSIIFPFSLLIPEDIAGETPDFPFNQFDCEPFVLSSGTVLLVNNALDTIFNKTFTVGTDTYYNITNQLEDSTVGDNAIIGLITFDDEAESTKFVDFATLAGVTLTPVTV